MNKEGRRRGRRLRFVTIGLVAAYLAAAGYMYLFQRSFVFLPGGALAHPLDRELGGVDVVRLQAADGASLSAWHAGARGGRPTILYFHGNSGNVSSRSERFRRILDAGFGLLAPSYRGYPGSSGSPSEAALISDGVAAFDWLSARADAIAIYGESLGTGVAVAVAAERDAAALVLEAPFSAAVDLAKDRYGWLPVDLLMKDPFRSRDRIGRIREPLLIVHGSEDRIVPIEQGKDLFAHAPQPKRLVEIAGAGHGNLWRSGLWPAVASFLQNPPR